MEFEIYPVLCNTNRNPQTIGIFYYDIEGEIQKINLITTFNPYTVRGAEPLLGYRIKVKQGYKYGFYWGCIYQVNNGNLYYPYEDRNLVPQYTSSNLNERAYVKNNGQATGEFQQIRAGIFYQYTNEEKTEGITYIGTEDWDDLDFQDIVFCYQRNCRNSFSR